MDLNVLVVEFTQEDQLKIDNAKMFLKTYEESLLLSLKKYGMSWKDSMCILLEDKHRLKILEYIQLIVESSTKRISNVSRVMMLIRSEIS